MGYYTDFGLKVKCDNHDPEYIFKLETEIDRLNVFCDGSYEEGWYANAKWYDYNEDMILLSSKFPDMLFELRGEGELARDLWLNYYKNGAVMRDCLVVTEMPFDESKLVKAMHIAEKYSYSDDSDDIIIFTRDKTSL